MRTSLVLTCWLAAMSGEELKIATAAPEWRQASVGRPWALRLEAGGAAGAVEWSLAEGALPPGVHLVEASMVMLGAQPGAVLYGAPAEAGAYGALLRVKDAEGRTAEGWLEIRVSLLRLRETSAMALVGKAFEWRPEVAEGVAPFTVQAAGFLPLGLVWREDGTLAGEARIAGRYEVALEAADAGGNVLKTTADVTVYGAETALPAVGVRLKREGCQVTAEWTPVPEGIEVRTFGGAGDMALEVEVTSRESGERAVGWYAAPAGCGSGPQG